MQLQAGAVYIVEENLGFGRNPAVHADVEFVAVREVANWWEARGSSSDATSVYEFTNTDGHLVLVSANRLVSARLLREPGQA
jgi:hypothetical protein